MGFGIPIFDQVYDGINSAWNDFTGKTATNMSAKAAEQNTQKQIEWERERATNAHQWEIQDLEKAGLNPVLSAGGSGAVTGGISPQLPDISKYKGTGGALLEIIPMVSQLQNQIATTAKIKEETDMTRELTNIQKAKLGLIKQQTFNERYKGLWSKKEYENYEDILKNKLSKNIDGMTEGLTRVIESMLEKFGINNNSSYSLGTKLNEVSEKGKNITKYSAKKALEASLYPLGQMEEYLLKMLFNNY